MSFQTQFWIKIRVNSCQYRDKKKICQTTEAQTQKYKFYYHIIQVQVSKTGQAAEYVPFERRIPLNCAFWSAGEGKWSRNCFLRLLSGRYLDLLALILLGSLLFCSPILCCILELLGDFEFAILALAPSSKY